MASNEENSEITKNEVESQAENLNQNNSSVENKKKTKKKKVAPKVHPIAVELMKNFPVQLESTKAKGRHSVAPRPIEAGTLVNDEKATAWIVRDIYMRDFCHHCNEDIGINFQTGNNTVGCEQCKWAFYCSAQCKSNASKFHSLQCSALPKLISIAEQSETDLDLIRLVLALIAQKKVDSTEENSTLNASNDQKPTPFVLFEDLLTHRERFPSSWVDSVTMAMNALSQVLSEELEDVMTVDEMLLSACRINSNSHGFGDVKGRNRDISLGLAPLTSLFFNHSCVPNCSFVGTKGGKLQVRTLRNIEKGEELVVNYVDIFAPRYERRQRLMATKFFWCTCKRCSENYLESPDRFLNAIKCEQCKDGYVFVEPLKNAEDLEKEEVTNPTYTCGSCKKETPAETLQQTVHNILESLSLGHNLIQEKQYSRAKVALQQTLTLAEKHLHPGNCFIANISAPLMNCYDFEDDFMNAMKTNKIIISSMEKSNALPPNWHEIADYSANLGELCAKAANNSKNQVIAKKLRQESREAYQKAYNIRVIGCGRDHPKTVSIAKLAGKK